VNLTDVLDHVAQVLAPAADSDPSVLGTSDALAAPCLMLGWSDPWLEPMGPGCTYFARLLVRGVVARAPEPGPGVESMAGLMCYALSKLDADTESWPVLDVTAPREFEVGGVPYLDARITVRTAVTVEVPAPAPA